MKKIAVLSLLIAICTLLSVTVVACGDGLDEQLQIYVPDGAPALAVASVIKNSAIGSYKANVTVTTGENVKAKCASANPEADVAILPTNACVAICSSTDAYRLFTTNVWGLLYVIGYEDISDLSELKGKTIASIGLGDTGERLFKRILDERNVSYTDKDGVAIDYVADGTTAVGYLMQGKCDFALVGEPVATNAINNAKVKGKTLYRVFDLQLLWQEVTDSDISGYPQASVIVKKSLLERAGFADALYGALSQNSLFLASNVEGLTELLQSAGSSLKTAFTADIIESCNLNAVKACQIKSEIQSYLEQLGNKFAQMLKDDLYYEFQS